VTGATLDTNIYVAAFEFGGIGARLLGMARAAMFRLDVSDAILDETLGVLREKFRWEGYRLHDARLKILRIANHVSPSRVLDVVAADSDDNRILECAIEAGSEHVVTEDKDLLRMGSFEGIRILRASAFSQTLIR
jgi:putative PIN family toxin of toxin-antitoxin system